MSDEVKIDMQRVIKDELWARLDEVMRPVGSRHELDVSATTLGDWLGDRVFAALFEAGFAALSAPSEPVPDGPRVWGGPGCYPPVSSVPDGPRAWAMPVIPSDVKAVHDGDGVTWRRGGEGWIANDDDEDSRGIGEDELIADYGPLAEVVEESTP